MAALNDVASAAARAAGAHAMTDITGFGLLGHLHSLALASGVAVRIDAATVPALDGVVELLEEEDAVSGGSARNRAYAETFTVFADDVPRPRRRLLCDATTSGGLLVALPPRAQAPWASWSGASRRASRAPSWWSSARAWSGRGPVARPVFKTGEARQTALEGSTPSPLRMTEPTSAERLRALPSVDRLATAVARAELDARRAELLGGATDEADLIARATAAPEAAARAQRDRRRRAHQPRPRPAGRARPRGRGARRRQLLQSRARPDHWGARLAAHPHVEGLLAELTGAQAALVVNNCAAAVLLAVAALAGRRETVVSRGQLVEIGGGFRIPEVLAQAGTRLVEVGTTNRTRPSDYPAAVRAAGDRVGAILRAHPSNFRTLGFVQDAAIEELRGLGAPVIDDVGSGVLAEDLELLADEPAVRRSVRAGAALVAFSGDKLLGGPPAGVLVGVRDAITGCRGHPLARAVRIDKLSLAALEATLALYRDPAAERRAIPVLAMLDAGPEDLERRERRLAVETGGRVVRATARAGGGALPLLELPGPAVALEPGPAGPDALAAALRAGDPPLVGRVHDGRLLLDPRTLTDEEARQAAAVVRAARW
jgi:L-seryl-tRNA(Ser) seleniumtransferase